MKKLYLLTKTLLAAALLCVGQSAWAAGYTQTVLDFTAWGTSTGLAVTVDYEATPIVSTAGTNVYMATNENVNGKDGSNIFKNYFAFDNPGSSSDTWAKRTIYYKSGSGGLQLKGKRRLVSIQNLSVGDYITVEHNSGTTLYIRSKNVSYMNNDGVLTAISTQAEDEAHQLVSGTQYLITSGNSFDFYAASSSNEYAIQKVTINHPNTPISYHTPDMDYQFKKWYAAGQYTSTLSGTSTSATGGATVYAETATYNGHDITRMATDSKDGDNYKFNSGSDGIISPYSSKTRTVSILGVKANDLVLVSVKRGASDKGGTITISSETATTHSFSSTSTSMTFSQKVSQDGTFDMSLSGSTTITFPYITIEKPQTMTIGETKYRTFSAPEAIDISGQENFAAYYASSESDGVVTMTKIDDGIIPANTGVMLYGTDGTFYYTTETGSTDFSSNLLRPVLSDAQEVKTTYGDNTTYILVKNASNIIGFGKLSAASTNMGGKAFLLLPTGSGEARGVRFVFDDGNNVTGINEASAATTETVAKNGKYFENGKLVIYKSGRKYNANGTEIK